MIGNRTEKRVGAAPKRYKAEVHPAAPSLAFLVGCQWDPGDYSQLSIKLVCESWLRGQRKIDVCSRVGLSAVLTASPGSQL